MIPKRDTQNLHHLRSGKAPLRDVIANNYSVVVLDPVHERSDTSLEIALATVTGTLLWGREGHDGFLTPSARAVFLVDKLRSDRLEAAHWFDERLEQGQPAGHLRLCDDPRLFLDEQEDRDWLVDQIRDLDFNYHNLTVVVNPLSLFVARPDDNELVHSTLVLFDTAVHDAVSDVQLVIIHREPPDAQQMPTWIRSLNWPVVRAPWPGAEDEGA